MLGSRVVVTDVEKRHAGILQCMATNGVGSAYGSAMLQVSPKQVTAQNTNGEIQPEPEEIEFEGIFFMTYKIYKLNAKSDK